MRNRPELKAEWDCLAKIKGDKKACDDGFYTFLNDGSKGQRNAWDDRSKNMLTGAITPVDREQFQCRE